MKLHTSILLLIGIISISTLQAQNFNAKASTSFTVWTVDGNVSYTEKGASESVSVTPGMTIQENGTINIGKKSSVRLVRNKDIVSINEKSSYHLNGTNISKVTEKQSEATAYFFEKLIASAKFYGNKKSLSDAGAGFGKANRAEGLTEKGSGFGTEDGKAAVKETGGGFGTEDGKAAVKETGGGFGTEDGKAAVKETGGGFGTEDGKAAVKETGGGFGTEDGKAAVKETGGGFGTENKINILTPSKGNSLSGKSTISWTPTGENDVYQVIIFSNHGNPYLLSAYTSKNSFTFDASELAFDPNQKYYTQVRTIGGKGILSEKTKVSFVSATEKEKALAPLMADPLFKSCNQVQQLLMKATAMEKAKLFSEADMFYQKALSINATDPIANQMYAAFLEHHD